MSQNKPRKSESFPILTNQEMEAINRAAADGKHGKNYSNSDYRGARVHAVPGSAHEVHIPALSDENGFEAIEKLTIEQDADSALAMLYIVNLLAPPNSVGVTAAEVWVSFDDVISKIGWTPRNTAHREELRRRIHGVLKFGERAVVVGQRKKAYKDKMTGKVRDTRIESSLWRIHKTEMPEPSTLFPQLEAPIAAQIVITSDWLQLLTSPDMAQFLPFGEALGMIPGAKPSGAWARVIGLSLASFWRRNPVAAFDSSLKPTRRELLERYPPKTGTVEEVLASKDPRRAIEYWCGALAILVESGVVEASGEAIIGYEAMRESMGRKGWVEGWLDVTVELCPGTLTTPSVQERALSAPTKKAFTK